MPLRGMQRGSEGPSRKAEQEDGDLRPPENQGDDGQAPQDSRDVIDGPRLLPPAHQTKHGMFHVVRAVAALQRDAQRVLPV